MNTWFPKRTFDLLKLFKDLSLYPQTEAPTFSQRGGTISAGTAIALAAPAGKIYYTTDGSDPRAIGGGIGLAATEYTGAFPVGDATNVRVRALNGSDWSALDEATFAVGVVPATAANLRVAEVHYHPSDPSPAEIAAGFADSDEFEFIELANISDQTIDLTNVRLTQFVVGANEQGVGFNFADSSLTRLAPAARVVIVENLAAFSARYGAGPSVAGQWIGRLDNSGETITLAAGGDVLQQFTYDDGWHPSTDGQGPSLQIIDPTDSDLSRWNQSSAWRPSATLGGTPGSSTDNSVPGDANGDGIFDSADLVAVYQAGEYEDAIDDNSTFAEGDWDGDSDFTTRDFVYAFQLGSYVSAQPSRRARHTAVDLALLEDDSLFDFEF